MFLILITSREYISSQAVRSTVVDLLVEEVIFNLVDLSEIRFMP